MILVRSETAPAVAPAARLPALDRPATAPAHPRPRPGAVVLAWVALGNAVLWLTFLQLDHVTVYLSSDSGHYLGDADALLGRGVVESRHLPGFPAVLAALRLVLDDLAAVWVAMGLLLLVLLGCLWAFVRGRVGSLAGELAAGAVLLLNPLTAEAVGWYGAAMLLGLALSLLAYRLIDDALRTPTTLGILLAGACVGAVGLTHPYSLVFLAEVSALSCVALALGAAWTGRARPRALLARAVAQGRVLAAVAAAAACLLVVGLPFYLRLENPLSPDVTPARLSLLTDWAFREAPLFWILLGVAGLFLVPLSRRVAGPAGGRAAVWATSVAVVAVANVIVGGGNGSYATRSLYALPLFPAMLVGVLAGDLEHSRRRLPSRAGKPAAALAMAAAVVVVAQLGTSYVHRLQVALPYYNTLSLQELEAIRWLQGRPGTVVVASRNGALNAGTLHAWMIQGLSRVRAMGPGERFLYLLPVAVDESMDAQRVLSGATVTEASGVRLASTPGSTSPLDVAVLVGGAWYPALSAEPTPGPDGAGVGPALTAAQARVTRVGGVSTVDLRPPSVGGDLMLSAGGYLSGRLYGVEQGRGRVSYRHEFGDRSVKVELVPSGGATLAVEYAATGRLRLRLVQPSGGAGGLQVRLAGLDPPTPPTAAQFSDLGLIAKRDVRYVFAWNGSWELERLLARPCLERAVANDEVTILAVRASCRQEDGGP